MFGYITVNKDTLSEENKKIYQSYYCGLCQTMKSQYGRRAQMALNYDMTFLIVLLTGLYEPDSVTRDGFVCSVHPTKKRTLRTNEITEYAAAMNILLAYYNLIDDWKDDKSLTKKTYAEMLKKDFEKAKKGYPIQAKAIEDYIARLAECEKSNDTNIDAVAGLTGEMLGILFAWKQDEWQKDLKEFGCYMGKFIYLMDAYDDVEKDSKDGSYNPFKELYKQEGFEEKVRQYLELIMSYCCRAFEVLPIIDNAEIMRNILYVCVLAKYTRVTQERNKPETTGEGENKAAEKAAE